MLKTGIHVVANKSTFEHAQTIIRIRLNQTFSKLQNLVWCVFHECLIIGYFHCACLDRARQIFIEACINPLPPYAMITMIGIFWSQICIQFIVIYC